MKIPLRQTLQFVLGFLVGYLAMYGLSTMILGWAASGALERQRRMMGAIRLEPITRENCPHCSHWHSEGMECCICRMPAREDDGEAEKGKVTVQ